MITIGEYDYIGLADSYLAQDRSEAATANGRLSYVGSTLYSYRSKIAIIYDYTEQILFINKNMYHRSVTTTKHINNLHVAVVKQDWTTFTIYFNCCPEENLQIYWGDISTLIDKHKRARTTKNAYKKQIHALLTEAQKYAKLHKLEVPIPDSIISSLFSNKILN